MIVLLLLFKRAEELAIVFKVLFSIGVFSAEFC